MFELSEQLFTVLSSLKIVSFTGYRNDPKFSDR